MRRNSSQYFSQPQFLVKNELICSLITLPFSHGLLMVWVVWWTIIYREEVCERWLGINTDEGVSGECFTDPPEKLTDFWNSNIPFSAPKFFRKGEQAQPGRAGLLFFHFLLDDLSTLHLVLHSIRTKTFSKKAMCFCRGDRVWTTKSYFRVSSGWCKSKTDSGIIHHHDWRVKVRFILLLQ